MRRWIRFGCCGRSATAQERLVGIADRAVGVEQPAPTVPTLQEFLAGLRTAWQEGEVRPTAKPKPKAKRLAAAP